MVTIDDVRPDWRTMTRDAFDTSVGTTQLALDGMPVTDPCGTADMLTLLDGSLTDENDCPAGRGES